MRQLIDDPQKLDQPVSGCFRRRLGFSATSSGTALKTATIGGVTVLTNAKGFTLYSFVPDTATKFELQRGVRDILAAGEGPGDRGARRHRYAHHDHALGRLDAGHLRRASALHLRR